MECPAYWISGPFFPNDYSMFILLADFEKCGLEYPCIFSKSLLLDTLNTLSLVMPKICVV